MLEMHKPKLAAFVEWVGQYITGDEKGQAQLCLNKLFQAFGHPGSLEVGGTRVGNARPTRQWPLVRRG